MSAISGQTILAVDNVSAGYTVTPVIQNISLDIRFGEVFGLIGLNGAGKTTLIKNILGLRNYQSGGIRIQGLPVNVKESRASLAYLPERFDPPWFLSGMEFVKFSLRLYGRPFNPQAVIDAAESLALDPAALRRLVHTYSKGMRQKLGLIGTLLTGCALYILDEPMSGLDPRARTLVKDWLQKNRSADQTVFLSSHILADLDEICDRVAVLHDGMIRFIGSPAELKALTQENHLERAFLSFIEEKNRA
ncbi:MAG: ABC transporter ATP-binding protein [Alphaproteobacteria bacterium]|nr:ABC transporter ATP-binding protein [Alphaproteobacteria bacterium]